MSLDRPPASLHFDDAPSVKTALPGPKSAAIIERQSRLESATVAYPKQLPIALDAAAGATIRDVDGNHYLDLFSGIGVVNVGHSNPYVVDGVREQVGMLTHSLDFPSDVRLEFLEQLGSILPGSLPDGFRVAFGGPTGSNAIEATLKLVRLHTGKTGMLAFRGGYHGSTFASLSLSGNNKRKRGIGPLVPGSTFAPYPGGTSPRSVAEVIDTIHEVITDPYSGSPEIGGIWVEAIQGEGGVTVPPDDFLPELRALASDLDVVLVVDEIQTGMGRTGRWFACDHVGVTPDVMPVAKAIGGIGLPLSATVIREEFDTWGPGGHVGTFRGHLPAMVAGTRAIEYIRRHALLDHATRVGSMIRDRFSEVAADTNRIADVRGRGLFVGIELADAAGTPDPELVTTVRNTCLRNGVIVWSAGRHKHVLRLMPPLVITEAQATRGVDIVIDALRDAIRE